MKGSFQYSKPALADAVNRKFSPRLEWLELYYKCEIGIFRDYLLFYVQILFLGSVVWMVYKKCKIVIFF